MDSGDRVCWGWKGLGVKGRGLKASGEGSRSVVGAWDSLGQSLEAVGHNRGDNAWEPRCGTSTWGPVLGATGQGLGVGGYSDPTKLGQWVNGATRAEPDALPPPPWPCPR